MLMVVVKTIQGRGGGGGSILRNSAGEVLFAQADYYGETTNSVAEAKALLQGLELCKTQGIDVVDIEVDSTMLVQILRIRLVFHGLLFMK